MGRSPSLCVCRRVWTSDVVLRFVWTNYQFTADKIRTSPPLIDANTYLWYGSSSQVSDCYDSGLTTEISSVWVLCLAPVVSHSTTWCLCESLQAGCVHGPLSHLSQSCSSSYKLLTCVLAVILCDGSCKPPGVFLVSDAVLHLYTRTHTHVNTHTHTERAEVYQTPYCHLLNISVFGLVNIMYCTYLHP